MAPDLPTAHNRLAAASSPYLRMHAGNPVAWQPWDEDALKQARETDTPILLSIGYSACHWCHVMAHECFENPGIAAAMNRGFVNVKLDREERPDIDRVYQLAHQALSGRGGGWPLTVFLDPQTLAPFYIGTYFPPAPRHGLPGFPEVLQRVREYFDTHRAALQEQAQALQGWLQRAETSGNDSMPDCKTVAAFALQRIAARFDPDWGGSRGAPKFPRAAELEWLLELAGAPRSPRERGSGEGSKSSDLAQATDPHPALQATFSQGEKEKRMAHLTLAKMAERGLQDHLGGGFFRYCVDQGWTIPHFEKMLYDNAQLLPVYARLAATGGVGPNLHDTALAATQGIVDWLAREMTAPNDVFYSAISADSEGEEGRFYLWTREQVRTVLPEALFPLVGQAFGLDQPPNFEGNAWHLLRTTPLDALARQLDRPPTDIEAEYVAARNQLFEAREQRQRPLCDDKILTAWNALAISGLARSALLLDDTRCAAMAQRALATLRDAVWIDGALFANAAEPAARIPGFLDDYAFLLDALLEVMQLAFDSRDLAWAIALADAVLTRFEDRENGGFWFSTQAHETPLARSRNWTDDALPNGNGVAVRALLRLGHLIGDTRYLGAAERALLAASETLQQYPDACATLLLALREFEQPRTQIVVRCARAQSAIRRTALREAMRDPCMPSNVDAIDAFIIPDESGILPGLLSERTARGENGTAYVCSGLTCQAPVMSANELVPALRAANRT